MTTFNLVETIGISDEEYNSLVAGGGESGYSGGGKSGYSGYGGKSGVGGFKTGSSSTHTCSTDGRGGVGCATTLSSSRSKSGGKK